MSLCSGSVLSGSCEIQYKMEYAAKAKTNSNALTTCAVDLFQLLTTPAHLGYPIALPKYSYPFALSQIVLKAWFISAILGS